MATFDDIPADQRAVLSLIVRRRKSYAEIAAALEIDEEAVYERAHAALAELAGEQASGLSDSEREQIGDYLLNQQSPSERLIAYDELEGSAPGRAFAQTVAAELSAISGGALPAIPAGEGRSLEGGASRPRDAVAPAPARRAGDARPRGRGARAGRARSSSGRAPRQAAGASGPESADASAPAQAEGARPVDASADVGTAAGGADVASGERRRGDRATVTKALPSSRVGGAILLAAIVIGVVLAVVLISGGGSSGMKGASASSLSATNAGSGSTGATGATGQVHLEKQLKLTPPGGAGDSVGEAAVLSESGKYVIALAAEKLPPTNGFFYAAWLYNSPSNAFALGKAPAVSSNGQLKPVAQALPESAASYHQLIITKETSEHPTQPGEIVLSGPFELH
jgi:hypothetical protein